MTPGSGTTVAARYGWSREAFTACREISTWLPCSWLLRAWRCAGRSVRCWAPAPLLISLLPVIVAAWSGGVASGILAAVVGGTLATYFFVEPARSFDLSHTPDFARVQQRLRSSLQDRC